MRILKKIKLNIFDYLIIVVLIIIIIYLSVTKIFSSKTKNGIQNINVMVFCEDVPIIAKSRLKKETKLYAGNKNLNFGVLKEFQTFDLKNENKFFNASFNAECRARKNDSGGYVIDGTTYYIGQDIRLFAESILMSGYIYEIN